MMQNFGMRSGYNQIAPGRDVEEYRQPGRPGRPRNPVVQQAIGSPIGLPTQATSYVPPTGGFMGGRDTSFGPTGFQDKLSVGYHRQGEIPQAERAAYDSALADVDKQIGNLGMWDKPQYNALSQQRETLVRNFFGNSAPQTTSMPEIPNGGAVPNSGRPAGIREGEPDPNGTLEKPDYTKLGAFANKLYGYNMDKFNKPYDQLTEKYKVGMLQSHFDPLKGVSPDYLEALKTLGIADYSGSGDKMTVSNPRNSDRVRYGTGGTADVIKGFKGQNEDTMWMPWYVDEGGGAAQAPQGFAGAMGMPQQITSSPLMAAILGAPAVPQQQQGQDYAAQLRQQIMQALSVSPELAGIGKTFGY